MFLSTYILFKSVENTQHKKESFAKALNNFHEEEGGRSRRRKKTGTSELV